MSGSRVTYLDSSALVKLVLAESESAALRRYLRRRQPQVSSALARAEVARAVMPFGLEAQKRAREVLRRLTLVRVSDRVLLAAGALPPPELRSLDALHLATAQLLTQSLARIVTYDERLADAAKALGFATTSPA